MKKHEFTITLAGVSSITDELEDSLFEAGCDDSTISGGGGVVRLDFNRKAKTFEQAVESAKADIKKAGYESACVER